ncbi:hypothetical protein MVEN_00627200 [Mycena venus]|uniref:Uncharacterized protein n=1 Tax=Mycena venus TaxID=2733690 RepID=A0A8H6YKF9_9AGAR|nr:hypothetical protein MVEN_00627200 [Mycena venus]
MIIHAWRIGITTILDFDTPPRHQDACVLSASPRQIRIPVNVLLVAMLVGGSDSKDSPSDICFPDLCEWTHVLDPPYSHLSHTSTTISAYLVTNDSNDTLPLFPPSSGISRCRSRPRHRSPPCPPPPLTWASHEILALDANGREGRVLLSRRHLPFVAFVTPSTSPGYGCIGWEAMGLGSTMRDCMAALSRATLRAIPYAAHSSESDRLKDDGAATRADNSLRRPFHTASFHLSSLFPL